MAIRLFSEKDAAVTIREEYIEANISSHSADVLIERA